MHNHFFYITRHTQQTKKCITFVQRRLNVFDAGPTLYKCYTNVLCLLGIYDWRFSPQGTGVTLNDDHIKWADGYMFVYDVTRPNTLYACESYRELLCDTRKAVTVPLMIIGNKTDLWPARQVTKEQGIYISITYNHPLPVRLEPFSI